LFGILKTTKWLS